VASGASSSSRRASPAGRSRSAALYQRAASAGALGAAAWPAWASTAIAASSPGSAQRSMWCARAGSGPPSRSSAAAARACAVSRQPAPVDSYAARRTIGWRKR
jgi:hypothetical protein